MSRPEILAPAGNREMLGAAVFSGADAVYLGLTGFNARRTAGNFTPDELREAVAFCHARGVKVHVTLNTLVYDRELSGLADAVRAVAAAGADAVIADDLATAQLVKSIAPTLHLHGSTQMSVHTPEGAKELAALGYDRVILARELSLEEIRAVCEASPIEVEVFVHGALCMSVSGQCMMSAFLGGRSGNRGACAGPCRLPFEANALPEGKPGRLHHLSLKDNSVIDKLDQLQAIGVASAKIEGRLRTPEYAAAAVTACRAARAADGQRKDENTRQKNPFHLFCPPSVKIPTPSITGAPHGKGQRGSGFFPVRSNRPGPGELPGRRFAEKDADREDRAEASGELAGDHRGGHMGAVSAVLRRPQIRSAPVTVSSPIARACSYSSRFFRFISP